MTLEFVKNIQFTSLIKAEGRLREFNFRKIGRDKGEIFTVDVVDDKGNRLLFRMHKETAGWAIAGEVEPPKWVYAVEKKLQEAIDTELAAN